jgi:hypothetical protein
MYGQTETFTLLAFTAFVLTICWLALFRSNGITKDDTGFTSQPGALDVVDAVDEDLSLGSLGVGDVVAVIGKAAGEFERIVRPITAAERDYLWVDGRRYRRTDGLQADAQWFELQLSRIEVEPEWAE